MKGLQLLADDEATARLGHDLARSLRPGDVVLLEGDLGVGKTALARAIIRQLAGEPQLEVPSPTFAIVQPYQSPVGPVLHADLYRLSAPEEIEELGLLDDPQAILLVEWSERAPELQDSANWRVELALPPNGVGRLVEIHRLDPER